MELPAAAYALDVSYPFYVPPLDIRIFQTCKWVVQYHALVLSEYQFIIAGVGKHFKLKCLF